MKWIYVLLGIFSTIIIAYFFVSYGMKHKNIEPIPPKMTINEEQELVIEVISEGSGSEAKPGDKVSVDYTGKLENGTEFDSSIPRGQPFEFILGKGQVIKGWEQGIVGMKVGETRKLTIPHQLAYGEQGFSNIIPPRATLIFTVKLLGIK